MADAKQARRILAIAVVLDRPSRQLGAQAGGTKLSPMAPSKLQG
jgi:hypothetical protein